ncbi:MAG: anthranilate phosphoribosyltransferase [Candidatus Bathyarchaeia archaeon]
MEIKEIIATLAEGKDLSPKVAEDVMRLIMAGGVTEAQIAAFLTALKFKGETVDELESFAKVMRESCVPVRPKVNGILVDTCGTGGDKIKTFNVSTLVALVVSGAGGYVAKHGNRSVTGRCGSADLMEGFGVNIQASPKIVEECIEELGIGFIFAPLFHPAMKNVAKVRKEMGIKTVFNVLGPLTNPAPVKAQLLGVYSADLTEKLAEVLSRLGVERALVTHGLIGVDEISIIGETRVTELNQGAIATYHIKPSMFGLKEASRIEELLGGDLEENIGHCIRILNGAKDQKADMAVLNSAAGIVACGRADNIQEGIDLARESIESGRALKKLTLLIKKTGGDMGRFEEAQRRHA